MKRLEVFYKGSGVHGLILFEQWGFKQMNDYFKRYYPDVMMLPGEEPLFWIKTEADREFIKKLYGKVNYPAAQTELE